MTDCFVSFADICKAIITLAENPILRKSPYAGMLFNGQGRPLNPDGWSSTLPASMGGNRTPIIDKHHLYEYRESWPFNIARNKNRPNFRSGTVITI